MSGIFNLFAREHVASIREVQKNPSKALRGITRVMRGSKTIGFFLSNEDLEELLEDVGVVRKPAFKVPITKDRREMKTGKMMPREDVHR